MTLDNPVSKELIRKAHKYPLSSDARRLNRILCSQNHKGDFCWVNGKTLFCQEGYCACCQIYKDFSDRVIKE